MNGPGAWAGFSFGSPITSRHTFIPRRAGFVIIVVATAMLAGCSGDGTPPTGQPDADVSGPAAAADVPLPEIDPALIRYEQTAEILTGLEKVRGPGRRPRG